MQSRKNQMVWAVLLKKGRKREGDFRIPTDERLKDKKQEKVLLIAMVEDLLRRGVVLREATENGPYLVFPSQSVRENPDLPDPNGKSVIFKFEGPVVNIYATLVVRLAYSGIFKKSAMEECRDVSNKNGRNMWNVPAQLWRRARRTDAVL